MRKSESKNDSMEQKLLADPQRVVTCEREKTTIFALSTKICELFTITHRII